MHITSEILAQLVLMSLHLHVVSHETPTYHYSPDTTFRGQFVKVGSLDQSWLQLVV